MLGCRAGTPSRTARSRRKLRAYPPVRIGKAPRHERSGANRTSRRLPRADAQQGHCRPYGTKVAHQGERVGMADGDPVLIDDGQCEAGALEKTPAVRDLDEGPAGRERTLGGDLGLRKAKKDSASSRKVSPPSMAEDATVEPTPRSVSEQRTPEIIDELQGKSRDREIRAPEQAAVLIRSSRPGARRGLRTGDKSHHMVRRPLWTRASAGSELSACCRRLAIATGNDRSSRSSATWRSRKSRESRAPGRAGVRRVLGDRAAPRAPQSGARSLGYHVDRAARSGRERRPSRLRLGSPERHGRGQGYAPADTRTHRPHLQGHRCRRTAHVGDP